MSEIIRIIAVVVYHSLKFDRNRGIIKCLRPLLGMECFPSRKSYITSPSKWEHQAALEVIQPPSTAQGNENDTDRECI